MDKNEISQEMVYRLLSEMVAELQYLFDESLLVRYRAMRRLSEKFNILRSYSDVIRRMNQSYFEDHYGQIQMTQMQMPGNPEINENQPEFIPEKPSNGEKTFTLTELSHYNGKDGMPAYVAYRNVVYDLTNLPRWIFGRHFGLVAGRDLTIQYDACHVGRPTLDRVPVVGRLVPDFPEIE